jgi:GT2 family glycosyltransferase
MDVSVIIRGTETATGVEAGLRAHDRLYVHDNTDPNLGFAAGHNANVRKGQDPLVCFVNPDGALESGCLDQLELAFDDPTVVAADADIGEAWNLPTLPDGSPSYLSGACLAVRRDAFERVGGFDERFFIYGEDVDLSWKLRKLGRLVHVADAHFAHDPDKRRSFRSLHRVFCHWHVVYKRHEGDARILQNLRDATFDLRSGRVRHGVARLTGTIDYLVRARRWVRPV